MSWFEHTKTNGAIANSSTANTSNYNNIYGYITDANTVGVSTSTSTKSGPTLVVGKSTFDGDNGVITYTDADGKTIVFDFKKEHQVRLIMDELREHFPEALFHLIMKGII